MEIIVTTQAYNPLLKANVYPLLALDMWEHSYWNDYDHNVQEYLDNFWKTVNWKQVYENFANVQLIRKKEEEESQSSI